MHIRKAARSFYENENEIMENKDRNTKPTSRFS